LHQEKSGNPAINYKINLNFKLTVFGSGHLFLLLHLFERLRPDGGSGPLLVEVLVADGRVGRPS
jgi:hypothetical protein